MTINHSPRRCQFACASEDAFAFRYPIGHSNRTRRAIPRGVNAVTPVMT
jgi:hypothetical protein